MPEAACDLCRHTSGNLQYAPSYKSPTEKLSGRRTQPTKCHRQEHPQRCQDRHNSFLQLTPPYPRLTALTGHIAQSTFVSTSNKAHNMALRGQCQRLENLYSGQRSVSRLAEGRAALADAYVVGTDGASEPLNPGLCRADMPRRANENLIYL